LKWVIRSAQALAAALVAVSAVACNRGEADDYTAMTPTYAVVERRDLDVKAEASGLIEPIKLVEVKSKASGEIVALHVETGDEVERGALLADVDPRDVENAYQQALADRDVAKARLASAISERERTEELMRAGYVTQQEYESALLNEANQNAAAIKAETNLQLATERRNDVTIRAPIAGTVISRSVEEGTVIASASQNVSGGTVLMQMADLSQVQIRALVDETDLGRIRPGQEAEISVDAYPDRTFAGAVLKIEPLAQVEQNVTMFPVLISLNNDERLLKPGMNAAIVFEIAQRTNVLAVPNAAVINTRDAIVAGEILGISEEAVQTALQGGAPASPGSLRVARADPDQPPGSGAGGQTATTRDPQQQTRRGGDNARGGEGRGGRNSRGGAPRTRSAMAGALDAARPAVVFVQADDGTRSARRVMLGVNDWDYSEVVSGLEEGERVVLMSVARIQQQQEEFNDRMRERATGALTGRGGMDGGRGRGR